MLDLFSSYMLLKEQVEVRTVHVELAGWRRASVALRFCANQSNRFMVRMDESGRSQANRRA